MEAASGVRYPKRLIEVDLPIARISAHARREKSIRHGHISTLHIWWARRPLAACRAVILASLWLDPAPAEDEVPCPRGFVVAARKWMAEWAARCASKASVESSKRITAIRENAKVLSIPLELRGALLDFIADFANWDRSTDPDYLEIARALTQAAHESLGGKAGTRPLVIDPFAGGGAIPLEALRVGANAYASDLNPVAVLLNKVVLEYIPKYGQRLADEVRKWGQWVKEQAEKELAAFYPKDPDGATPIAYLWARTIRCEGPGCGADVPMLRSLWLAKKGRQSFALKRVVDKERKQLSFDVIPMPSARDIEPGTVKLGSVTCPVCDYTTKVDRVREQLNLRNGGADDARLLCVVTTRSGQPGRWYRRPTERDFAATENAKRELGHQQEAHTSPLSLVPDEPTPLDGTGSLGGGYRTRKYGIVNFGQMFSSRQLLAITTLGKLVRRAGVEQATQSPELSEATVNILACAVDRAAESLSSFCRWNSSGQKMQATFGRQALPIVWDFCEANPIGGSVGSWENILECVMIPFESVLAISHAGSVSQMPAQQHVLPDDSASVLMTDPPYYDAVPYSDLSDFFYVWMKRTAHKNQSQLFDPPLTPKREECIVDRLTGKEKAFFENSMRQALAEGRRVVAPTGIGIIVFAHKATSGWEAMLEALIGSGWIVSASWPLDTEMGTRLRAQNSAALASSIHIICRPRENSDGSVQADSVGDWRDVLDELPLRIAAWMKRLKAEDVVGADAIFACLGPALEIFSRYSRVEKASGDVVPLREYLEQVWATVSNEAVKLVFEGGEAESLEPDARLTTMWLWTLGGGKNDEPADKEGEEIEDEDSEEEKATPKTTGFVLEFDAARMIAQGLGIHLEKSESIVHAKGETARLLAVAERAPYLFGKGADMKGPIATPARKKKEQLTLGLGDEGSAPANTTRSDRFGALQINSPGATVLDRLHQAMILFGASRSEALRAFLVDEGHGRDERLWRLADSLAALYPRGSEERRWVEGVSGRKKAFGL